jgi:ATP-binding protein involved in chromosome partitioning
VKSYFDITGDGGSQIVAQVQAQQAAIRQAMEGVRHLVAVGSGKGGVGKSTVTAALAQALRTEGQRVAILDADFNGPCQAQLAGLTAAPWLPGEVGLCLPKSADGIGVLSFGSILEDAAPVQFDSVSEGEEFTWRATQEFTLLGQLLAGVEWGELDFLLLDLPPGTERTQHYAQFFGSRAAFILVTIPTVLAQGVVARSVTALEQEGARLLGVIENMVGYYCRQCGDLQPLFPSADADHSVPSLGKIPFDPLFAASGGRDEAEADLPPRQAIGEIARNLIESLES